VATVAGPSDDCSSVDGVSSEAVAGDPDASADTAIALRAPAIAALTMVATILLLLAI